MVVVAREGEKGWPDHRIERLPIRSSGTISENAREVDLVGQNHWVISLRFHHLSFVSLDCVDIWSPPSHSFSPLSLPVQLPVRAVRQIWVLVLINPRGIGRNQMKMNQGGNSRQRGNECRKTGRAKRGGRVNIQWLPYAMCNLAWKTKKMVARRRCERVKRPTGRERGSTFLRSIMSIISSILSRSTID